MKLEHLFLGICLLLLATTGILAVHYRTELLVERATRSAVAPAIPAAPAAAPAVAAAPPVDREAARVEAENERLREQLKKSEDEAKLIGAQAKRIKGNIDQGLPADQPPLTDTQIKIKEQPSVAKVKKYLEKDGIAVLDHGTDRGFKTDQAYAVRRGVFIIARKIVIGSEVDAGECAALVDPASLPPGEVLKAGDEVIKWDL